MIRNVNGTAGAWSAMPVTEEITVFVALGFLIFSNFDGNDLVGEIAHRDGNSLSSGQCPIGGFQSDAIFMSLVDKAGYLGTSFKAEPFHTSLGDFILARADPGSIPSALNFCFRDAVFFHQEVKVTII